MKGESPHALKGQAPSQNRRAWLNSTVGGAGLTSALGDFSYETTTVILPGFLTVLGIPAAALGIIEGVADAVTSFTKMVSGYTADKFGHRKALVLVVTALTVATSRRYLEAARYRPAEYYALILLAARFFTDLKKEDLDWKELLKISGLIALPMLLVAKQPDLGTALTYAPILVIGVLLTGLRWQYIVVLAVVGFVAGSADRRAKNFFTWGPIVEVAILFAAIFVTMTPMLEILNAWSQGAREIFGIRYGVTTPAQFFWTTGALSSVLDNAPTYLAFAAAAAGLHGVAPHGAYLGALAVNPDAARLLAAISTGAVFMGANTYIGNAPNFMVKAIAEESGVTMPSFFGYLAYSGAILLPLFIVVALVFF